MALALVKQNQKPLGSFRHSIRYLIILQITRNDQETDLYLECCCFSPAARSLSAPLAGYQLSYDPRKDMHSAINNSVPPYNSPAKLVGCVQQISKALCHSLQTISVTFSCVSHTYYEDFSQQLMCCTESLELLLIFNFYTLLGFYTQDIKYTAFTGQYLKITKHQHRYNIH